MATTNTLRAGVIAAAATSLIPNSTPQAVAQAGQIETQPPNVLFIIVDDLRADLGFLRSPSISAGLDLDENPASLTPNIDALAARGTVFERAFCQVPVCGASRCSMLTGLLPTKHPGENGGRFWGGHISLWTDGLTELTTLNSSFKQAGYTTIERGKVYHHPKDDWDGWDDRWRGPWRRVHTPRNHRILGESGSASLAWEVGVDEHGRSLPDEMYSDGQTAARAVQDLMGFADSGEPFFLAVGFFKPHLPFNAPKNYWDRIDPAQIDLATNPFLPTNAPDMAFTDQPELNTYAEIPDERPVPDDLARSLIHGYLACTTFIDTQVGKILQTLDATGLDDNTIVVFTSDHGFMLGEHSLWAKYYTLDAAAQVPLIIATPEHAPPTSQSPGMTIGRAEGLAALVDLYPTLIDLAGIPEPTTHTLAGVSLVPMLNDPSVSVRDAVYTRWQKSDSVRTETHRLIRYVSNDDREVGTLLFDLGADPAENTGLEPASRAEIYRDLGAHLETTIRAAREHPVAEESGLRSGN
ncbi:MAG: sulfatase [Planctomycetota bacterium]